MQLMQSTISKKVLLFTCITVFVSLGCARKLPTPEPPKGKGWTTIAQGYHLYTYSQSSSTYGNTTVTTTTQSSSYQNVSDDKRVFSDDIPITVSAGHNVSEYRLNEDIWNAYALTAPPATVQPVMAPSIPCTTEVDCPGEEFCDNAVCVSTAVESGSATSCTKNEDCSENETCENTVCTAPSAQSCNKDTECSGEQRCENSVCVSPQGGAI